MGAYYVRHRSEASQRGQIAVEYILLLAVGVTIAALITSLVVSRSDENPGFMIKKWRDLIVFIGTDKIEK